MKEKWNNNINITMRINTFPQQTSAITKSPWAGSSGIEESLQSYQRPPWACQLLFPLFTLAAAYVGFHNAKRGGDQGEEMVDTHKAGLRAGGSGLNAIRWSYTSLWELRRDTLSVQKIRQLVLNTIYSSLPRRNRTPPRLTFQRLAAPFTTPNQLKLIGRIRFCCWETKAPRGIWTCDSIIS
jgi:hypothetical protein